MFSFSSDSWLAQNKVRPKKQINSTEQFYFLSPSILWKKRTTEKRKIEIDKIFK